MGTWPSGSTDSREEFRAFATSQRPGLYRAALVLTADPGLAEDLVQTALTQTYARWSRLRQQDAGGYARRVLVNANIDRWRRLRDRERLTDAVPERSVGDVTEDIAQRDAVLHALTALTVQERRVVVLRFLEDRSESDTARELGIPLGTVKSVTHRAIAKLRASSHLNETGEVTS